jgi:tRNA pseudouridine65 synthase
LILPILAQGADWAIVAKPAKLLVHRNELAPRAPAALQLVRNQLKRRVNAIHRLDRAASGCLLFATEPEAAGPLSAALTGGRKRYVAFVRGEWKRGPEPVAVDNPIKDERGTEKAAHSVVRCLATSAEPRCSLLLVEITTGRHHQVRRHVRDLNHPVIGDTKHGDSKVNRHWRETWGLDRLGLHALDLACDRDGERILATCPLFDDLARVLIRMPWWAEAVAAEPALGLAPLWPAV